MVEAYRDFSCLRFFIFFDSIVVKTKVCYSTNRKFIVCTILLCRGESETMTGLVKRVSPVVNRNRVGDPETGG